MAQRYDVVSARTYTDRDGNEKTAWTRIGTMFANKSGDGFSISLDALPIPQLRDGKLELRVSCFPPKERDGQPSGNGRPAPDLSDEIPY